MWLLVLAVLLLLGGLGVKNLVAGSRRRPLPPGPPAIPIFGNILWLWHPLSGIEPLLQQLHKQYGPVVALRIGTSRVVFVNDRHIAHQALVQHGTALANRPKQTEARRLITHGAQGITSASYGPRWRLLRRNLVSETLHQARLREFAPARSWVLRMLIDRLRSKSQEEENGVRVMETLQFAMFSLLVCMCFGQKLSDEAVREIGAVHRDMLVNSSKLNVFSIAPMLTMRLFRKRLEHALAIRERRSKIFFPLIQARREHRKGIAGVQSEAHFPHCYVDTLLELTVPEEGGRSLTDDELLVLCSEFLNAGTDTTATGLQWIMAELVKNPDIQRKLYSEIAAASIEGEIKEEDLQQLPYLKAVVMEGLRRHPPGHFVLPHAAAEDMEIGGYFIPKGTTVNFEVAQIGWDETAWEKPMEFIPERFLSGGGGDGIDVTGNREIRMMPFGAGRRICAGINIAMLHLEYFVGNMVKELEWQEVAGEEVDVVSEKVEFTVVMRKPLRAKLLPRHTQD